MTKPTSVLNLRPVLAAMLLTLTTLLGVLSAPAATITFSAPGTCSADSDVNVGGLGLAAYTWGTAGTVNGVAFTASTASSGAVGSYIVLSGFSAANASAFVAPANTPWKNLSTVPPGYTNVLKGSVYNGAVTTTGTVTLTNLVVGHQYAFQVWTGDPRSGATTNRWETIVNTDGSGGQVLNFNTTHALGGVGQYSIGTFTADATSQQFNLVGAGTTNLPQMNLMQLRDRTGYWSGTTDGNWANADNSSVNFSGLSFVGVKSIGVTNVFFADKSGSGVAVTQTNITITAGGVTGVNAVFQNQTVKYALTPADTTGLNGAYSVTLQGTNTVTLNGTNTYTGNTIISAGTLVLGTNAAIPNSAVVSLAAGTTLDATAGGLVLGASQTLSGSGIVKGSPTLSGAKVNPGGAGVAGVLTFTNSPTLSSAALTFDLSANPVSGNDQIVVGGALTNTGATIVTLNYLSGTISNGTYTLIQTLSGITGSGTFALDRTTYPYRNVTLVNNGTSLTLVVGAGGSSFNLTWKGDGSANTWDVSSTPNWLYSSNATVFYPSDNVTFDNTGFNSPAINLSATLTPGIVTVNSTNNYTFSGTGKLSGAASLTKAGTDTLTLTTANDYTGVTTISAGTLALSGGNNRLPTAGTVNFTGAGTLAFSGISQTLGNLTLADGVTVTNVGAGGALNLGASNFQLGSSAANNAQTLDLSGVDTLVYNGPALTFAVSGRYTGAAGVSTGTLTLAKTNSITAATFGVGNVGRSVSLANSDNVGNIYLGQSNTIYADTLQFGGNQAYGYVYFRSGLTSPTLKIRAADGVSRARLNLGTGDNSNYTPSVGTLNLVNGVSGVAVLDAYIGTALLGQSSFGSGGSIGTVGTLVMGGGLLDATNIILGQRTGTDTSGGLEYGTLNINGGTVKVGALTMGDQQNGTGTVTATVNMFDGATLQAQTILPGAGAPTSTVNWNGGTLQNYPGTNLYAYNVRFNLGTSGTPTALVDSNTTNTLDSVSATITGSGSLTKTGPGTLVLGGFNSATGPIYVNTGTLALSGVLAANKLVSVAAPATFDVSAAPGGYTLASGQALGGAGTVLGNVTVNNVTSAQIMPGSATTAGTLTLSNELVLNGGMLTFGLGANTSSPNSQIYVAGTLYNNGAPTYISLNFLATFAAAGTYTLVSSPNAMVNGGAFALDKDYRNVTLNVGTTNITVTVGAGGVPGLLTWKGDGSANYWDVTNTPNWLNTGSPDVFFPGDYAVFDDAGTNTPAVDLQATLLPGRVNVTAAKNYTFSTTGSGSLAGSMSLVKSGTGSLTLALANTYTGGTVVSNGTLIVTADPAFVSGATVQGGALQIGDGVSSSGSVTGDIVNNSQVTLNRPDAPTVANNISGTGGVVQSGAGAVTLSGANTYTGPTTITNGTLTAGSTTALGAVGGAGATVNSGGILDINGANLTGTAKVILNGGWLVNNGTAQGSALTNLSVNGNSFIGGVNEFDVRANTVPTALVTVGNGVTLTKTNSNFIYLEVDGTVANNGLIDVGEGILGLARGATAGSGSFTVEPAGVLYLYGVMTNTLPVTLNGGVLSGYSSSGPWQQGNVTLTAPSTISNNIQWTVSGTINNNGNALTLAGSSATSFKGQITGSGSLISTGNSMYLLSTNNNYTGGTFFNSGSLMIGDGNTSAGSLPGDVISGAPGIILWLQPPANITCVITGAISGGATLLKQYAGTSVLTSTNNTFTGGIILQNNGGVLQVTSPGALGTSSVTVNSTGTGSGTLQLAMTGVNTITNPFTTFKSESAFSLGGLAQIENVSGTNTINSNLSVPGTGGNGITVQSDADLLILAGSIYSTNTSRLVDLGGIGNGVVTGSVTNGTNGAAFGLIKDGTGTWTLAGINGYTATTTVNAGTLLVNGSTANTAVNVGTNAVVGGSGKLGGTTTLLAGGIVQAGDANYSGTLTNAGSLNLGAATNGIDVTYSRFNIAAGGKIATTTLNVNGTNIVTILDSTLVVGTYDLIYYTGAIGSNGFSGFKLGALPLGVNANLQTNATTVQLAVTSIGLPPVVTLTSPASSSAYAGYATIPLAASVATNGNTITSVDFLTNGTVLTTVTIPTAGTNYDANWTLALPGAYTVIARANYTGMVTPAAATNSSITVNALVQPVASAPKHDNSGFSLSFNGPSGQPYSILSTTNVALPRSTWDTNQTGFLTGSPMSYTNATPSDARRFYDVRSP